MVDIKPFKGTRPHKEEAEKIIAPSTDHLSEKGIIDIHEKNYWSYLKVLNPVGQLKNEEALRVAKEQFDKMKKKHIIKQEDHECFYIYRIQAQSHIQTGFLSITKIDNFINNLIKGHELTYEDRIQERADQMLNIETQIGPIYVSYKDNTDLDNFINQLTISSIPQYDFKSFDESQHTLWCIEEEININKIIYFSENIDFFYIADGHHRMGALSKLLNYQLSINNSHLGTEGYNYFMIAAFPKSQSKIYDYNRVIKNLNGLTVEQFLSKIKESFDCEISSKPVRPSCLREYGMYHNNYWYVLRFKNEELLEDNILSKLDINIIDKFCLKPILGINDAGKEDRIRFIAGCHGLEALEKKVNDNPDSVAFSIFPTHIDDVIEVANQNLTMPPKTTWFDPKPLDGLVVYEFNQ